MEPGQEFLSSSIQGLPTPQVLATVMRQAQQLLSGSARAALSVHHMFLPLVFLHFLFRSALSVNLLCESFFFFV